MPGVRPFGSAGGRRGQNLIVNGDAETGTTSGWNAFAGVRTLATAAYAPPVFLVPDAPHGSQMYVGDAGGLAADCQMVDVGDNAAALDAGGMNFNLAAQLGGLGDQEDNPLLFVAFLDAGNAEIDHTELGPIFIDLRANLTVLGDFGTEGTVPAGTRAVQFNLSMDAPDGDSSGAFADNMSFTLSAVPEPQSWVEFRWLRVPVVRLVPTALALSRGAGKPAIPPRP